MSGRPKWLVPSVIRGCPRLFAAGNRAIYLVAVVATTALAGFSTVTGVP
jgi:hypothetical protein